MSYSVSLLFCTIFFICFIYVVLSFVLGDLLFLMMSLKLFPEERNEEKKKETMIFGKKKKKMKCDKETIFDE